MSRELKSLKTQLSWERKKIVEKSKSGCATISEHNIWFGYNMMKFLEENHITKGRHSTIEVLLNFPTDGCGHTTIILV